LAALLLEPASNFKLSDGSLGSGANFASEIGRRPPVRMQPVNKDTGEGRRQLVGLEICTNRVGHNRVLFAAAQCTRPILL
jgi:hypothetical protein